MARALRIIEMLEDEEKQIRKEERVMVREIREALDLPDNEFLESYKVSKEMITYLCNELQEDLAPRNRLGYPVIIKVLNSLKILIEGNYQRGTGEEAQQCVAQSTVSKYFDEFVDAVNTRLKPQWITFPGTPEARCHITAGFFEKSGVNDILGVIDCTQIKIFPPPGLQNPQYRNRHGDMSINVQLVADVDAKIMNVNANYPGRCHDQFIFNNSIVKEEMRRLYEQRIGKYFLLVSRRKRANYPEYTRWRSNVPTTPEFIVKVFDEDISTAVPNPIVAVNIQPMTKRGEKIIVGGVMLPPPTPMQLTDVPREYTRFVPPTTVPVTRYEEELYLAPVPNPPYEANEPMAPDTGPGVQMRVLDDKFIERDESPPASPHFLQTQSPKVFRQFAPIAPVSFSRKYTYDSTYESDKTPTRTTTMSTGEFAPRRSDPDEILTFPTFQSFSEETTYSTQDFLMSRTTDSYSHAFTKLPESSDRRHNIMYKKPADVSDISYQDMFQYNDEYKNGKAKQGKTDRFHLYHEEIETAETEPSSVGTSDSMLDWGLNDIDDIPKRRTLTAVTRTMTTPVTRTTDHIVSAFIPTHINTSMKLELVDTDESSEEKAKMKTPVCSLLKYRKLNFNSPRHLHEIVAQLKSWADTSPLAKMVDITDGNFTVMENPIYLMMVDDPSSGQIISAKQTVMVVAGIHGRDHHAVAAALYLLYQLIERSEAHTDLLTKYRFWIVPVFNPDGYEYSMTFPHRREWMKNLRQSWDICKSRESCRQCASHGIRCNIQPCYGVNLDRNFEYQWIPPDELKAEHPCGTLYAGSRQLSESETRALTHFLHEQRMPLFTFIAFKEGDVLGVMYPYSHTKKRRAFDYVYRQRASRAASAAYSISGRPYVAGQTSEFLSLYAGGIEDWVDGHLGIDNTYTIMMFRPTDSYNSKIITERVVHEAYAAMDTLLLQSVEAPGPPIVTHQSRKELTAPSAATRIHLQATLQVTLLVLSLPVVLYR